MNDTTLRRALAILFALLVPAFCFAALAQPQVSKPNDPSTKASPRSVVEITATDYAFRAPREIPSGWTTIRFANDGEEPHMLFMSRLPDGVTIEDYEIELSEPTNDAWLSIRDRNVSPQKAMGGLFEKLPQWYGGVEFAGGVGVTPAGRTTQTILHLEPGYYVLECYMKTDEEERHDMEGMLRPLMVTDERTSAQPPAADIRVTLSNSGMDVQGATETGIQTVEVFFDENPAQGFPHNVHAARLENGTELDELVAWMNAFSVGGMSPAAPAEFLGGVQMMPEGKTGYFTIDLEPGRYVFLSEMTAHQGVMHAFEVE